MTNTGNVPLDNVFVTDDRLLDPLVCQLRTLAVAQSATCDASKIAILGACVNIGTASGDFAGHSVTDTDASHCIDVPPDRRPDSW